MAFLKMGPKVYVGLVRILRFDPAPQTIDPVSIDVFVADDPFFNRSNCRTIADYIAIFFELDIELMDPDGLEPFE
jgi:hypothetical protein